MMKHQDNNFFTEDISSMKESNLQFDINPDKIDYFRTPLKDKPKGNHRFQYITQQNKNKLLLNPKQEIQSNDVKIQYHYQKQTINDTLHLNGEENVSRKGKFQADYLQSLQNTPSMNNKKRSLNLQKGSKIQSKTDSDVEYIEDFSEQEDHAQNSTVKKEAKYNSQNSNLNYPSTPQYPLKSFINKDIQASANTQIMPNQIEISNNKPNNSSLEFYAQNEQILYKSTRIRSSTLQQKYYDEVKQQQYYQGGKARNFKQQDYHQIPKIMSSRPLSQQPSQERLQGQKFTNPFEYPNNLKTVKFAIKQNPAAILPQNEEFIFQNTNLNEIVSLNQEQQSEIKQTLQRVLPPKQAKPLVGNIISQFVELYQALSDSIIEKDKLKDYKRIHVLLQQAEKNEESYLRVIAPLIYEREKKLQPSSLLNLQITEQNQKLKQKIEKQRRQFGLLKEEHKANIIKLEEQIKEEQTKVNDTKQNLCVKEAELKNVQNKLTNIEKTLKESQAKLVETESKLLENEVKLEEKEAKLVESEAKLAENKAKLEETQLQNTKLQIQNDELEQQLEKSKQNQIQVIEKLFDDLSLTNLQGEQTEVQVQQILEQLNPKTEIQTQQVQFAMAFQSITKNQPDEEQQISLQDKNDDIVNQFLGNNQNLDSSTGNNSNATSLSQKQKDTIQCLLVLQNMFKQDGITTYITDQTIASLEQDDHYKIQQSYLQTGLHNQTFFFSLRMNEDSSLFSKLFNAPNKQGLLDFIQSFKQDIGQMIDSEKPDQDIVILNIAYDNVPQIDFQINSEKFTQEQIQKKITFDDIGLSLSEKNLLEFAKLSVEMFNPQFNMEWPMSKKGNYETRGQLKFFCFDAPIEQKYHFPAGYKGYALNIDRYGDDKAWISNKSDDQTWIVLFHGTNEKAIEGIMENNLLPGQRNYYGGQQCRITNTMIMQGEYMNIYLTDEIDIAEYYATQTSLYEGKQYKVVFQCRVNPKAVKSPVKQPNFYTVFDNQNIRPYRILLKEC